MIINILLQFTEQKIADSLLQTPCPSCNSTGTLRMQIYQKYTKVFFIPYATAGKEVRVNCTNCDADFGKNTLTAGMRDDYNKLSKKAPFWMYTGAGLSAVFLLFVIWLIVDMQREKERLVMNPEAGTVYDIKYEDKVFGLVKVKEVKGDSVYLVNSTYQADNYSGFDQLRDKPYNETDVHAMHKTQLKEWYESGAIRGARVN